MSNLESGISYNILVISSLYTLYNDVLLLLISHFLFLFICIVISLYIFCKTVYPVETNLNVLVAYNLFYLVDEAMKRDEYGHRDICTI